MKTLLRVLIVAGVIPAFVLPFLPGIESARDTLGSLFTLYPLYVSCAALCAWMCVPKRPEVAWILFGVILLSHAGVALLCYGY